MPYFADHAAQGAFRIILDDAVSVEEGTGIVHSAPAFGEVDFYACQREGIDLSALSTIMDDSPRKFLNITGLFVKDADKEIIKRLKKEGKVFIRRHAITAILFAGVPTPL